MSPKISINTAIDHLFRHEYARTVSYLVSKFGAIHIDIIEDAVQDALFKAMTIWSYQEIPKNPGKWLYKVAQHAVIDQLRRAKKSVAFEPEIGAQHMEVNSNENFEHIEDEQLKMIFACCHPSMKESEQLMLSLKLLCGFSNHEIARALLKESEAVKKGITRAKQKFKTKVGHLELPDEQHCSDRLQAVLKVIYLIFTNGYTAYSGDAVLTKDVCEDAMRLASMLYQKDQFNIPETRALLALMCFNFSRFDARTDDNGNLLSMQQQNWTLWNKGLINIGLKFINESAEGDQLSTYHIEAAIASTYSTAKDFESINWPAILKYYDLLLAKQNNPSAILNRLVIVEKISGTKAAYQALKKLDEKKFKSNHIYFSIKAEFEKKLDKAIFKKSLKQAIALTNNQKEKDFLSKKL